MEKHTEKLHKQITVGLGNHDVSPAALAYKMHRESKYVNESLLQYMVSYINLMANAKVIPVHLAEIQSICKYLNISLEELGLVGDVGRQPHAVNEFLQV
jgi:hypothetical protein